MEQEHLDNNSIARYSRQLIMPEIGVTGQAHLKQSRVLIIGAGGLGCPAAQYLVAAGVGTIGLVDYDTVEFSNLHRQILHTEKAAEENWSKVQSAADSLKKLNSSTDIRPILAQLNKENASAIVQEYDVVIDATDNVSTRYLISDVCVLTNKPLISGSALRWEGQLTVYHHTDKNGTIGPCYRCLYPTPPQPESITNCSDGGVIGAVPGIIGCMQALESLKILTGLEPSFHEKLYIFDGLGGNSKTVKLRSRKLSCICCGKDPSISLNSLPDYVSFCGTSANDKCRMRNLLAPEERMSVREYQNLLISSTRHVLLDVRNAVELDICSLPDCVNIPIRRLKVMDACTLNLFSDVNQFPEIARLRSAIAKYLPNVSEHIGNSKDSDRGAEDNILVCVICRIGNDSQLAVKILKRLLSSSIPVQVMDIKGGIMAWAQQIDKSMAQY